MSLLGILAVVAGFVGMAAIVMAGSAVAALAMGRSPATAAGEPPPGRGYLVFDFALGMLAALAGGMTTAWLAPFAPIGHALALSGLVLAMALVCLLTYGDNGPPRWYQALLSLVSSGVVVAGAWLIAP